MNNKFNETDTLFRNIYLTLPKSDIEFSPIELTPNKQYYYLGKIQRKQHIILKEHAGLAFIIACQSKKSDTAKSDLQSRIAEYIELIEVINKHISNPSIALIILQEICRDIRAAQKPNSSNRISRADLPATDRQLSYLKKLGSNIQQPELTREQASKLIGELLSKKPVSIEKLPVRIP